jgi:hypothetical protein
MPSKLNSEILAAAIEGFEAQKRRIDEQIAGLRAMLSGESAEPAAAPEGVPRKRRVSAAARRRMALAQRARWAKMRGESAPPTPAAESEPLRAKRRISEEGMKRIIAATKKRWAAIRAAKAKAAK